MRLLMIRIRESREREYRESERAAAAPLLPVGEDSVGARVDTPALFLVYYALQGPWGGWFSLFA